MNVNLSLLPRLDAHGGGSASVLDIAVTGSPSPCGNLVQFSKLGRPISRQDAAISAATPFFANRWKDLKGYKPEFAEQAAREFVCGRQDASRQDGATDFVSSGLRAMLGPSEEVDRSEDREWLFVKRPGSPVALPSRQLIKPGYRSASYRVREFVGQAQFTDPNDLRSLQRASYSLEEKDIKASYYGVLWAYSVPETWEADILGEDLLANRQRAAMLALDEFDESLCSWGDVDRELSGMFTLGDAVRVIQGQQYSSGAVSPDDMLARIAYAEQMFKRYNGGRKPTGAIIPDGDRIAMQTTFFGAGGEGPSVWERAVGYDNTAAMFPWLRNAMFTERLNNGNADGNAARWVLFTGAGSDLFKEATPTMLFGPFPDWLDMVFVALRRTAGVVAKKPENVFYLDFTP